MSNAELHAFVNSAQAAASVTWDTTASDAPGGAAIKIIGGQTFAGRIGAGFPFIPIEDQEGQSSGDATATYYGEIWIKNVGTATRAHYVGASDFDGDFGTPDATGQAGNPGTYGYWVRYGGGSDDSSWTKYSGYVTGYHASDMGTFETGASFFSPLGIFNYDADTYAEGETDYCLISGWKIWKVSSIGNRTITGDLTVRSDAGAKIAIEGTHALLEFYEDGSGTGRSGFVGYDTDGENHLIINNENNSDVKIETNDTLRLTVHTDDNITTSSGASLTGGIWENASSREYKQNITPLSDADATAAIMALEPQNYTHKKQGTQHVGFIAEDVPDLLATESRKTLSPMDIVAALTKVVQRQEEQIKKLIEGGQDE
jgi:hypothetical protein